MQGLKKSGCIYIYQGFPDNEIMLCQNDSIITGLSSRVKGIFRGTNADTEVPGCAESKIEDKITINMMDLRECNQPDSRIWLNTYVSPETHETIAVKKYPATPA
jgi:hypothetical protein